MIVYRYIQHGMSAFIISALLCTGAVEAFANDPAKERQLEPVRAQLKPKNEVILSSGIAAKINRIPFRDGQTFNRGDLLIEFDCSIEKADYQYAKAAKMKAATTVEVNQQLDALQSISTLELKNSQADLQMAASRVAQIQAKLHACQELAPFDGRVAQLDVKPLQRVKPGEPLMVLYDPSVLEVELRVPSSWLRWIKPGERFNLHIEETDTSYEALVSTIGAFVDPVSQTVKIVGELNSPGSNVLPGMSGNAIFTPAGSSNG